MTGLDITAIQLMQAERAVKAHPGHTVAELAEAIACPDVPMLRERLVELERAGKVHRGPGLNTCRITGKKAGSWFPGADPFDDAKALPPELVNGYANALDAMTVPVDPLQDHRAPEHPVPASDTTLPA